MVQNETQPAKSPDSAQNAGFALNWILILAFTFWITSLFASYMIDQDQITLPYSVFLESIDKNEVNDNEQNEGPENPADDVQTQAK
jgi:hypothetical protein